MPPISIVPPASNEKRPHYLGSILGRFFGAASLAAFFSRLSLFVKRSALTARAQAARPVPVPPDCPWSLTSVWRTIGIVPQSFQKNEMIACTVLIWPRELYEFSATCGERKCEKYFFTFTLSCKGNIAFQIIFCLGKVEQWTVCYRIKVSFSGGTGDDSSSWEGAIKRLNYLLFWSGSPKLFLQERIVGGYRSAAGSRLTCEEWARIPPIPNTSCYRSLAKVARRRYCTWKTSHWLLLREAEEWPPLRLRRTLSWRYTQSFLRLWADHWLGCPWPCKRSPCFERDGLKIGDWLRWHSVDIPFFGFTTILAFGIWSELLFQFFQFLSR